MEEKQKPNKKFKAGAVPCGKLRFGISDS